MTALQAAREATISAAYRSAWSTVSHLPLPAARRAFNRIADAAVARRGPAVVQLARNLRRVLGEDATPESLHAAVQAAMRSYARYWLETFRVERMDLREVAEHALAGSVGLERVIKARDEGRGILLALPHSGNWDIAGLSMCHVMGGITVVAERLRPESLFRRFVRFRENLGFEVLPLTDESGAVTNSGTILRQRLEQGRMVCLLSDRDLAGNGVPVTFFGEATTMPAGPAMLAARTGAVLLPIHLAYKDGGWIQYFSAPLELPGTRLADQVRAGTQQIADRWAERISLFPADWHMLQPFWLADRSGDR